MLVGTTQLIQGVWKTQSNERHELEPSKPAGSIARFCVGVGLRFLVRRRHVDVPYVKKSKAKAIIRGKKGGPPAGLTKIRPSFLPQLM